MTVKELIEELQEMDPKDIVVMSKDPEGNNFSPLYEIACNSKYNDGEIGIKKLSKDHKAKGYTDEDVMKGGKSCIVLWPE